MCTVTLAYDKKNEHARQQLAALLATGLFIELDAEEEMNIGKIMSSAHDRVMQKSEYTLEEAYNLTMGEIKAIYDDKYAI